MTIIGPLIRWLLYTRTTWTGVVANFSNTYLFMGDVVDINSANARPNVPSIISC